jgi:hypothetical protein
MVRFGSKVLLLVALPLISAVGATSSPALAHDRSQMGGAHHGHHGHHGHHEEFGADETSTPWTGGDRDGTHHHYTGGGPLLPGNNGRYPGNYPSGHYGHFGPYPVGWRDHYRDHPFFYLNTGADYDGCYPEWRYDWSGNPYKKLVCNY